MAAQNPISNLQDVQAWLSTLVVNTATDISQAMFAAPRVVQTLALLPNSDPITLTPTAIDVAAATLTGTAKLLGEPDTTVTFTFSESASQLLLCTLAFTPPSSLSWMLVPSMGLTFGGISTTLTPDPDLNMTAITLVATVATKTTPPVTIPVTMLVPSYEGDWTLSTGKVAIGELTKDALNALAGGQDVLGILPSDLQALDKLTLTRFSMQFNLANQSWSVLQLGMSYEGDWKFFDEKFVVKSVTFDVEAFKPTPASDIAFDAKVYATMQIPPLPSFDVGGQFPDPVVFVQLTPGQVLKVTDVFAFFDLPVPSGMPDVEISTLGFTLHPSDGMFRFNLAITKPILIYQNPNGQSTVSLDKFLFDVSATYDPQTKGLVGQGALYTHFTIGQTNPTTLAISGAYQQGQGLDLIGQAGNVPLGELLADLATKFGIQPTDIPQPIRDLTLDAVRVELNTGATTFDFSCIATTKISGADILFVPKIHVNYGGTTVQFRFEGGLTLYSKQPDGTTKEIIFSLTFSTDPTDTWIDAKLATTGGAVEFEDIAGVFGVTLPPIPKDLDLGLTNLGFHYDFGSKTKPGGELTFGAMTNYGDAVFVARPIGGTPEYVFLVNAHAGFSLSNLPLVGQELAKIENVSVNKLRLAITTMDKIDAATAGTINQQIVSALGAGYPQLPSVGITGKILIAADLVLGNETLPLSVSLLGGDSVVGEPAQQRGRPLQLGDGSSDNGVKWFNVQRSFGPISIARIGVLYQSETQTLWFELDATLMFGPLTMTLQGLGVGSPLSDFAPEFNLQGLGVNYNEPPLTIAGALINLAPPGASYVEFAGAVMIGTGEFTVQAFGYYGNRYQFSSMFLFGDLLYPFGGPPAFFVTGVALGFGYNSALTIPTIGQVGVFPFVQVLANPDFFGKNATPATVLAKMIESGPNPGVNWVGPLNNSLWFAAGITFTSFELVNSVAMVFVEVGPELVIALIGVSRAQFPQSVAGSPTGRLYAMIELDLLLRFAPQEGIFSLEAMLAQGSFLLDQACSLMGGFAFYVWYTPNAHAGDFVVTLGGYHPGFTPPNYYPQVPRVGFNWALDSSINISGGTYFALTPAALMVGGSLNATYQAGELKAWFDAHADVIVRWKPFWFDAEIGITIGASYTLDLLFCSATFSLELGVDLELWGPPTGGRIHVDWYIISFTISFGWDKQSGQKIQGWNDGVQPMLPNTGTDSQYNVLTISPTAGLTPSGTAPGTAVADSTPLAWLVRGSQFGFAIDSPIPATTIDVGPQQVYPGLMQIAKTFEVYPLGWNGVTAAQTITAENEANVDYSGAFDITVTIKSVSAALWGSPPETGDGKPQVPAASGMLVPDQGTGISALVKAPATGTTAGPVNVAANLAYDNLNLGGAVVPLSATSPPIGVIPVASDQTVADIQDAQNGIGAVTTQAMRGTILAALVSLGVNPDTANDPMTEFANKVNCLLSDQPLLVPHGLGGAA